MTARWVMRGTILFALAFANLNDIWSPDVLPNALLSYTLLRSGNADYDEFVFRPGTTADPAKIDSEAYFFRACGVSTATTPPTAPRSRGGPPAAGPNDHVCSVFPPGMGLLALPFFLPFVLAGAPALDLSLLLRVGHVAAAFYEVVATLLLWAVLRRITGERAAVALVLLYFLGTSVRTVASQALWQHAGVHLVIAGALFLVIHEQPISPRRELLAGFALGLGGIVRQTATLAAIGVARWRAGTRGVAPLAVGAAVGLVPLLVFNALAFGSPLEQGYGVKPFDAPVLGGLVGLLFSPSRGLFIYEPWAIFGIAGLVIAFFARHTAGHLSERISTLLFAWLALLAVYATYAEWWGGRVFGPRFLDDFAPVLVVGVAWGLRGGWFAFGGTRALLVLASAWSLLIFNAAALVYDQSWDTLPVNVNDDPSRLFSWSDPQWLAVLVSVPNGGARVVAAIGLSALALLYLARVEHLLPSRR